MKLYDVGDWHLVICSVVGGLRCSYQQSVNQWNGSDSSPELLPISLNSDASAWRERFRGWISSIMKHQTEPPSYMIEPGK